MESLSQKKYRQKPEVRERMRIYRREWARKNYNPKRQRNANLKMNRGITLDDFNRMFDSQDGKCSICGNQFEAREGRNIHVDHDHETGRNRELLCNHCNLLIGYAKENAQTLLGAIAYLEKWKR